MRCKLCRSARSAAGWTCGWWLASQLAFADVPLGKLLWLQGLDGNPPLAGFEVDGTLRLESIDEPVDVGLNIIMGQVTNSVTGVIEVKAGPGGARYVTGPVLNHGRMDIAAGLSWYGNGRCENHGTINLYNHSGFVFIGAQTVLDLEDGAIVMADSPPGYVWVQNGKFIYNGGRTDLPIYVAQGSAQLGDSAINPIAVDFVGSGCSYDGALTAGRTLRLTADGRFPPLTLTLTRAPQLDGKMYLDAQPSGSPMAITLPPGGLFISAKGLFSMAAGGLGATVTGNLTNAGTIVQAGPLRLSGDQPVVNTGSWTVGNGASLTLATELIQTGGKFVLDGGQITNQSGITLLGGTFSGNGAIFGSVTNDTAVTLIRNQPLTVSGDWTDGDSAAFELQMAADDLTPDAAALQVGGHLTLASPLHVTMDGPFAWTAGQGVTLVSVTNLSFLTGWFHDVRLPALPAGMHWTMPATTNRFRFVTSTNPPALELAGQLGATNYSLAVFGPLGTGLVVEQSIDLRHWEAVTNQARFEGLARFTLPVPAVPELWYRAHFTAAAGN